MELRTWPSIEIMANPIHNISIEIITTTIYFLFKQKFGIKCNNQVEWYRVGDTNTPGNPHYNNEYTRVKSKSGDDDCATKIKCMQWRGGHGMQQAEDIDYHDGIWATLRPP